MNEFKIAKIREDLANKEKDELNIIFDMYENLVENEVFTGGELEDNKIIFKLVQEEIRRRNTN